MPAPKKTTESTSATDRRRSEWMVPTEDGLVPERVLRQKEREEARKKRAAAAKKNAELRKPESEESKGSEGDE